MDVHVFTSSTPSHTSNAEAGGVGDSSQFQYQECQLTTQKHTSVKQCQVNHWQNKDSGCFKEATYQKPEQATMILV